MIAANRIGITLCVAAIVVFSWFAPMDALSTQQTDAGLKRALVTYGTARLLHGAVSALQGTQVDAAPAGIGLTFSPGQILAPVAEMLKQFADLMLLVCVSFGIQKMLITIGGHWVVSLTLTMVGVAWALVQVRLRRPPALLTKALIVLIMVRFAIPLVALGSDALFQSFLVHKYQDSQVAIQSASTKTLADSSAPTSASENPGILDRLKRSVNDVGAGLAQRYSGIKAAVENATEHVVTLIVIFVLQTMVLPLLLLWGLYGLAKAAFQFPARSGSRPARTDR